MKFEVEQKFPLACVESVESRLRGLGAAWTEAIEQADFYFAHPARDFASTDEALRIRRAGDGNAVTYKGPKIDQATKTRRELEIALPPGQAGYEQFCELLAALGFSFVAEVRKRRRCAQVPWRGAAVEAAVDEVQGLGVFLELELSAEECELADARAKIASLAAELRLSGHERRSYLELLLESRSSSSPDA